MSGLKEKMERFNKRWSVTSNENEEEAFSKFKTRILNIFKDIDNHLTKESISTFCQFYGITEKWETHLYADRRWSKNVINRLVSEEKPVEFYKLLEFIFALDITRIMDYRSNRYSYSRDILLNNVAEAIDFSNVDVAVAVKDEEVIFYPSGEKTLDEELVEEPLSFLQGKSSEHFIDGLKFYQAKNYVKSAESLRRSIEEFLKEKLNNSKGLQANIKQVQSDLKSNGSDSSVRNIIFSTLNYLDTYFNDNSKHNDGDIDEAECEFLIYQTGLLMRYIDKVIK